MAGEGARLKEAREALGLTVADIEELTKIRGYYLKALENETYDILPGDTYVRGFMRNYARCLNIDPDEIIAQYTETNQPEETPLAMPAATIMGTPIWFKPFVIVVMAIFVVTIVFGISYISRSRGEPPLASYNKPLPTSPETESNNGTEPESDNKAQPESDSNPVSPPGENTPSDQESSDGPEGVGDGESEPPDEGMVAANSEAGNSGPQGDLTLELTFTERCWLVVRADGQTVIDGTLEGGEVRTLTATETFEFVTIGNAGGVSMVFNGQELPPLGGSGDVIKNYSLQRET